MAEHHQIAESRSSEKMPGDRRGLLVRIALDSAPGEMYRTRLGLEFTKALPGSEAAGTYSSGQLGLVQEDQVVLLGVRDDAHAKTLHACLRTAIDATNACDLG